MSDKGRPPATVLIGWRDDTLVRWWSNGWPRYQRPNWVELAEEELGGRVADAMYEENHRSPS